MSSSKQRDRHIFRITHYNNLELALKKGLFCPNSKLFTSKYKNIGHTNLIEKRGNRNVPIAPNGVLNDYVPFYFAPRSPMLYSIHKNNVDGYTGKQKDIVYLVSSIKTIIDADKNFVFTDGHAYELISKFYNKTSDLDKIDWTIMGAIYWNNNEFDNDRRRRRMAEFLVFENVPVSCILAIVVYEKKIKRIVDSIQQKCNTKIKTIIKRSWYYD